MTHSDGQPTSYRGGVSFNWVKPRGVRTLLLGVGASVTGIAGAVMRLVEGVGVLTVLGFPAVGILGLGLTVAWVVTYAREH
ncbi:hypothetical protein [Streptomyces sp. NPDC090026]|uniref:hypothetical protein n=1 Tax=Streptomyces sp. NPDC090026 TaxID=3365923 RepID=UPI003810ADFC